MADLDDPLPLLREDMERAWAALDALYEEKGQGAASEHHDDLAKAIRAIIDYIAGEDREALKQEERKDREIEQLRRQLGDALASRMPTHGNENDPGRPSRGSGPQAVGEPPRSTDRGPAGCDDGRGIPGTVQESGDEPAGRAGLAPRHAEVGNPPPRGASTDPARKLAVLVTIAKACAEPMERMDLGAFMPSRHNEFDESCRGLEEEASEVYRQTFKARASLRLFLNEARKRQPPTEEPCTPAPSATSPATATARTTRTAPQPTTAPTTAPTSPTTSTSSAPPTALAVGYFDSPEQEEPAFDPGLSVGCAVCPEPLTEETCRTVSVHRPGDPRSYFYRLHRTCDERLSEPVRQALDAMALKAEEATDPARDGGADPWRKQAPTVEEVRANRWWWYRHANGAVHLCALGEGDARAFDRGGEWSPCPPPAVPAAVERREMWQTGEHLFGDPAAACIYAKEVGHRVIRVLVTIHPADGGTK